MTVVKHEETKLPLNLFFQPCQGGKPHAKVWPALGEAGAAPGRTRATVQGCPHEELTLGTFPEDPECDGSDFQGLRVFLRTGGLGRTEGVDPFVEGIDSIVEPIICFIISNCSNLPLTGVRQSFPHCSPRSISRMGRMKGGAKGSNISFLKNPYSCNILKSKIKFTSFHLSPTSNHPSCLRHGDFGTTSAVRQDKPDSRRR